MDPVYLFHAIVTTILLTLLVMLSVHWWFHVVQHKQKQQKDNKHKKTPKNVTLCILTLLCNAMFFIVGAFGGTAFAFNMCKRDSQCHLFIQIAMFGSSLVIFILIHICVIYVCVVSV